MVKIPQHKVAKFNKFFSGSFLKVFEQSDKFFCSSCFLAARANLWKDLEKKSGEIEVIQKVKSFRIDTRLIRKKSILSVYYYRYSVLSKNIIHASVLICFQHTTTIIQVPVPQKATPQKATSFWSLFKFLQQ